MVGQLLDEDGESAELEKILDEVVIAMEELVSKRKSMKITVGHILHWKHFESSVLKRISAYWEMKRTLVAKGQLRSIYFLPIDHKGCSMLKDGIHLNEPGGKAYFSMVMDQSNTFFSKTTSSKPDDVVMRDWSEDINSPVRSQRTQKRSLSVESIEPKRSRFEQDGRKSGERYVKQVDYTFNRRNDIKTMAKLAEDQDYLENKMNLHKIVIQGLQIKGILETERPERIPLMKEAVKDLLTKISGLVDKMPIKEVTTVFLVNERAMKKDKEKKKKPMLEVSFGDTEYALNIRQAYGKMNAAWKRDEGGAPKPFRGIFINPALNHRTRVRLAVFKAISKGYNLKHANDNSNCWMVDHLPRPMMKLSEKREDGSERIRMLNFVEAATMAQTEGLVGKQDLIDAYKVAGRGYGRMLENMFILLK